MAGVRIVTDSACDLPPELAEEYQIDVVPLTIRFGDEELLDRRDLTPEQFWARCGTSPGFPGRSQNRLRQPGFIQIRQEVVANP